MLQFMDLEPHPVFDAALRGTPFRADRVDAWRGQLGVGDVAALDALDATLADHLLAWGYDRG
jgi:hypothetical protein